MVHLLFDSHLSTPMNKSMNASIQSGGLKEGKDQITSHLTYYISVRMSLANHPSSVKEKKRKKSI